MLLVNYNCACQLFWIKQNTRKINIVIDITSVSFASKMSYVDSCG